MYHSAAIAIRFLRWSFGRTHKQQDLASAYTVQFIPDEQGTFMEWSFEGVTCHGVFKPEASVAILNFCLQDSMVTITYRVLDANSACFVLQALLVRRWLTVLLLRGSHGCLHRGRRQRAHAHDPVRQHVSGQLDGVH
jgi:hypothetical protein